MIHHCPKCDSTNVIMGLDVLCCHDCNWMSRKMILGRTGPELDKLMATRIMKWVEVNPRDGCAYWALDSPFFNSQMANLDWSPASDLAAAFEVVREIITGDILLFRLEGNDDSKDAWKCEFVSPYSKSVYANTAPLAICRAALIAVNASPVDKAELQSTGT